MPNLHHSLLKDALKLSFGFDLGGKYLLRGRERVEASHEKPAVEA